MDITTLRGDTWQGAIFEILLNGAPLDLTDATFLCQVKKNTNDSEAVLELFPVIDEALEGKFSIPAQVIDIPARSYFYDIQISLQSGRILTPVSGAFIVTPDVSR